jgi:hypothetical protein
MYVPRAEMQMCGVDAGMAEAGAADRMHFHEASGRDSEPGNEPRPPPSIDPCCPNFGERGFEFSGVIRQAARALALLGETADDGCATCGAPWSGVQAPGAHRSIARTVRGHVGQKLAEILR